MCRDLDRSQRVDLLTKAIELVPLFCEAYFWRGILGNLSVKNSRKDLKRALHLLPASQRYQSLVIKSQIWAMKRHPDKAVELLTDALNYTKKDGNRGEVYYFRTFANWWVDNDEAAIEDCKLAIDYHYNTKSGYTQLADMYRLTHVSHQDIQQLYIKSVEPTPRHTELLKYGVFMSGIGKIDQAIELIEQSIERNPNSPDGYAELSYLKDRELNLKKVIELDKNGLFSRHLCNYVSMVAFDESLDTISEGIELLTEGIEKQFSSVELYILRAQLRLETCTSTEEKELVLSDLRMAVFLNPSNSEGQYMLGLALARFGKTKEAKEESEQRFRNALYITPDFPKLSEIRKKQILGNDQLQQFKFYENPLPVGEKISFGPRQQKNLSEVEGLLEHLKYSSVYQYVGITRRALTLLINFCTEKKILWEIFRKYWHQLYTWLNSPKDEVQRQARDAIDRLLQQSPDSSVYIPPILGGCPSQYANFVVQTQFGEKKLDSVMVFSEMSEKLFLMLLGCMDYNLFSVLECYLYRKDVRVSSETLIELFSSCREIPQLDSFIKNEFGHVLRNLSPIDECVFELRFSKIPKNFSHYVNNSEFSDVTFVFPKEAEPFDNISSTRDGHTEKVEGIKGHRVILASCGYFAGMFGSGLRESKESTITMFHISPEVFLEVMNFLYGGNVHLTTDNCIEILEVADRFGLEDLKILWKQWYQRRVLFFFFFFFFFQNIIYFPLHRNPNQIQKLSTSICVTSDRLTRRGRLLTIHTGFNQQKGITR
eukprot:TRINITY_DN11313_c0_g1_i6.p1 TRINITY_DN11313_c0_g1~~TRINITY_DN11313_c0_g1_i6.p1  ORF type:complete len:768 (+),score=151.84 TRINITY_DN11313_c0_g1_i6:269-2572(+)